MSSSLLSIRNNHITIVGPGLERNTHEARGGSSGTSGSCSAPKGRAELCGLFSAIYYFTLFNSLKPLSLDGNFRADDR